MKTKALKDILSPEELEFVMRVFRNPGAKLTPREAYSQINGQPLWNHPEGISLVIPTGSYKWIPTDRVVLSMEIPEDEAVEEQPTNERHN
jgi:hypothetical protein